jgi:LPXTG-motif cell wall-anchored protein
MGAGLFAIQFLKKHPWLIVAVMLLATLGPFFYFKRKKRLFQKLGYLPKEAEG